MTIEQANTPPNTEQANAAVRWLGHVRTGMLAAVVALPPAINAQNIVAWAHSPTGLGLNTPWAWAVFAGLDLAAAVCVAETLIQTGKGRKAGAFAAFVWAFACASAFAGYRHGTEPHVGRDVKWFFPFLALVGPALLHLILKRARLDKQAEEGRRLAHAPASSFGWRRWLPLVGAFAETYCAWRVALLEGIVRPADAVARYRRLRPLAGPQGLRVLAAMRSGVVGPSVVALAAAPGVRLSPWAQITERSVGAVHLPIVSANTPANTRGAEHPNTLTERASNTSPNTVTEQATEQANTVEANVRPITSARRTPNGDSNSDQITANLRAIKRKHKDWRTSMPSARSCAAVLGVSPSTGLSYQKRLIAELAREENVS